MEKIKGVYHKYCGLSVMSKSAIVYTFVSFFQKGLVFISTPIFTRLMTSAEYGTITIYNTTEQLIGTIAMFCLVAGCFDVGMQDYKDDRDVFVFSCLVLSNVITVITAIFVLLFYPYFTKYTHIGYKLFIIMFISFLLTPALNLWSRRERFEYKYRLPSVVILVSSILSILISVLLIFIYPDNKVDAKIFGSILPSIVAAMVIYYVLGKKAKYRINFSYIRFAFLFNLPLIPHYLSTYILNSSDRLMIANIQGETQAAYYALAYSVAAIVSIFWTAINSSFVPYAFGKYESGDFESVSKTCNKILLGFASICVIVIMFAPEIIMVMGTQEYTEAKYVIPSVVGGLFFQALYYIFTNVLYYYKKPVFVMISTLLSASLNILLNYIFIAQFGYFAAGYTTLFCFILQAIFDYIIVVKILGKKIFNLKFILLISLAVFLISITSNLLYESFLIRYLVIILIVFAVIHKREVLFQILFKRGV